MKSFFQSASVCHTFRLTPADLIHTWLEPEKQETVLIGTDLLDSFQLNKRGGRRLVEVRRTVIK